MTLRFRRDWELFRAGDVRDFGRGVALLLIERGIAEEFVPAKMLRQPENKAVRPRANK